MEISCAPKHSGYTLPAPRTIAISGQRCYFRLIKVSWIRGQSDKRCKLQRRVTSPSRSLRKSDGTSYSSKKEADRRAISCSNQQIRQTLNVGQCFPALWTESNKHVPLARTGFFFSYRISCLTIACHLCVCSHWIFHTTWTSTACRKCFHFLRFYCHIFGEW